MKTVFKGMVKGAALVAAVSALSACGGGSSIVDLSSEKVTIKVNDSFGNVGEVSGQPKVYEVAISELSIEAKMALFMTTVVDSPLDCINDGVTYDVTVTSRDGEESVYFSNNKACNDIEGQQFVLSEKVVSLIDLLDTIQPESGVSIEQGLYGTVTSESDVGTSSEPEVVSGFKVDVLTITESNGTSKPRPSQDIIANSDDNGFFEVAVPPGKYCVCTTFDRCTGITLNEGTMKLDYVFGAGPGWQAGKPGC